MDPILAIVWVRTRLLLNSLSRKASGWETAARVLTLGSSLLLSLGLAIGVGALTLEMVQLEKPGALAPPLYACFWLSAFFSLFMPLLLSSGASGIDTSRLVGFPISRWRLFGLTWASAFLGPDHMFVYPMLLATFCGLAFTAPSLGVAEVLIFLLVPLILVTWAVAAVHLVQGIMRQRRGKELLGMLGIGAMITVSVLPAFIGSGYETAPEESAEALSRYIHALVALAQATPPNLAAQGVLAAQAGTSEIVARNLGALLLWLALGLVASWQVFRWNLGAASRGSTTSSGSAGRLALPGLRRLLPFLPDAVLAVASKELKYLLRSSAGRFNFAILPLLCSVMLVVFSPKAVSVQFGFQSAETLVLYGLLLYTLFFTNNFVSNAAGWEGPGFKLYLLAPVPFRRVLFGKNLGVWIYASSLYALVIATWCVFHGLPSAGVLGGSAFMFGGAMLLFTASGNFASLAFPVARDISAMKSQPSHPAILVSVVTAVCLAVLVFTFLGLPWLLGLSIGPVAPLAAFFLLAVLCYRISLGPATELFARNRQKILEKLDSGT